jgi:hypothetical protein
VFLKLGAIAGNMLFFSTLICADSLNKEKLMNKSTVLKAFNNEANLDEWQVTNDAVMGGLSVGNTQLSSKALVFSGKISTENNGGFTSVFKKAPTLPEAVNSIRINILGDGNTYQLRVRSKVTGYVLAYNIDFDTKKDQLTEHTFYLADFTASFRGRIIENAPLLDAKSISHVGFLIKAKQEQRFSLSVQAIKFMS